MAKRVTGPEIEKLIQLLAKVPGLGPRSARRAALHLIKKKDQLMGPLAHAMGEAFDKVKVCSHCGNVDTVDPCTVCTDVQRDQSVIIVVEDVSDLWALERSGAVSAPYHVLGGVLSPLNGVGPDDLSIADLVERARDPAVTEVVLAVNATLYGGVVGYSIQRSSGSEDPRLLYPLLAVGAGIAGGSAGRIQGRTGGLQGGDRSLSRAFVELAEGAEAAEDEAEAAGARSAPSGTLRINMPIAYGRKVMLPLLARLREEHPAIALAAPPQGAQAGDAPAGSAVTPPPPQQADDATRAARLRLCDLTQKILTDGLHTLGGAGLSGAVALQCGAHFESDSGMSPSCHRHPARGAS